MKGDSIETDKTYELDYYERDEGNQGRDSVDKLKGEVSFVRKRLECMFYGSVVVTILFLAINGAILGLNLNNDPECRKNGPLNESETGSEKILTGQYLRLKHVICHICSCISVCRGLGPQQPDGRGLWPLLQAGLQPQELDRGEERVSGGRPAPRRPRLRP